MNVPGLEDFLDLPPWEWPEGSGNRFREVLLNRAAPRSDRLIAAELAGNLVVMDDKLAEALMMIVRNGAESEELRERAAISFGAALEQSDINEFEDPDDSPITERTFRAIQNLLRKLYDDDSTPKRVRRRILEAAVHAPQDWQRNAIRKAYASGDAEWMLTAVFGMRWVRGFDDQILEALQSSDAEIHYEAVEAAGNWELPAAWPHIAKLLRDRATPKPLLLAAIGAAAGIRPTEATEILSNLADSHDEDIAEAASEAIAIAEGRGDDDLEDDDEEEEEKKTGWIN
jgi:hypothetical protein